MAENKMLRNEVAALTDEVSSFASRMRASQDMLAELKKQLAAGEKKDKEIYNLRKELQTKEETLQKRLAAVEGDLATSQRKLKEADTKMQSLHKEKQMVLQDHTASSETNASVIALMRDECETAKRQLTEERQLRESEVSKLSARLAELEQAANEARSTLLQVQKQADESKGAFVLLDIAPAPASHHSISHLFSLRACSCFG